MAHLGITNTSDYVECDSRTWSGKVGCETEQEKATDKRKQQPEELRKGRQTRATHQRKGPSLRELGGTGESRNISPAACIIYVSTSKK